MFCDTSILDDVDNEIIINSNGNPVIQEHHCDNADYHSVIIDHELITEEDGGIILHEDGLIENGFVDESCLLTDDYVINNNNKYVNDSNLNDRNIITDDNNDNQLELSFPTILDEADAKLTAVVESVASSAGNSNDTLSFMKSYGDNNISDSNQENNNSNGGGHCLVMNQMYEEVESDANGTSRRKKATIVRCEYCGVILKHPSKIQAHMRTHTGEKPFECNICGMRFTQRTPMRMHVRRHIGDTPFKCSWGCGKSFVSNAIKNAHELRIHMGEKRQGPPCPHLKPPRRSIPLRFQTSADDPNLFESISDHPGISAEHLIGEHELDDEDGVDYSDNIDMDNDNGDDKFAIVHFEPPIGDIVKQQQTTQMANKRLDEIIESVASGMNVVLPSVVLPSSRGRRLPNRGRSFAIDPRVSNETTTKTRRSALVAQCEECGLILKHPSKIQAHLRTHTGEKPFECGICGWRFSTANPLRVHLRRAHTGEKPYECTWDCGRRFVTASARNEHERIVHAGIKRYQCRVGKCRRLFTRRRYLIMHQQKEHLEIDIDNIISFSNNYNKHSKFDNNNNNNSKTIFGKKDDLVTINNDNNKRASVNGRWSQFTQRCDNGMRMSEDALEEGDMEVASSDNAAVILTNDSNDNNNEIVNATKQLNDDHVLNLYTDDPNELHDEILEGGVNGYDQLHLYNGSDNNEDVNDNGYMIIDNNGNDVGDNVDDNIYLGGSNEECDIIGDNVNDSDIINSYFNEEVHHGETRHDAERHMDELASCSDNNIRNDDESIIEHRNYWLSTSSSMTKRPIVRRIRIIKPSKDVIYSHHQK